MTSRLSVIVISSDQRMQTELCLQSLCEQNFEPFSFDVHVCDDGEVDLSDLITSFRDKLNIYYHVLLPRSSSWRLSANRNIGLRYAESGRALFIDADCVLAPSVLKIHESYGTLPCVVGGRRRHIPQQSIQNLLVGNVPIHENALRYCTQEETRHWNETLCQLITAHLKNMDPVISQVNPDWISGFQVSYPVEFVRKIGGFWEKFNDYGGEELELHRRLAQLGLTFLVRIDAIVFHLDHPIHPSRKTMWWHTLLEESCRLKTLIRNHGPIQGTKAP